MKLYKLNNKELNKEKRQFNKTSYGKTINILTHILPILFFIICISNAITSIICPCIAIIQFISFSINLLLSLITFIIGSIIYYKELKEYVVNKNKLFGLIDK